MNTLLTLAQATPGIPPTDLSYYFSPEFLSTFERSFAIGDVISIGPTTGTVISIDLLSVKLRKADNVYVRIPNESVLKEQVSNVTRFPLRQVEISVGVAYKEDPERVMLILREL